MIRVILALIICFSFISTARAETDQELAFAKKVLAITRTDNFGDYMNMWHPSCTLGEHSADLVARCPIIATCSVPSPEQRDLHTRRNLLGLAQIMDMHVSPIAQIDQSGLPKDLADKVTEMMDHFSLKPNYYIWANVIHPQYGRQVAEIGYAIEDSGKLYIVDGSCMDHPVPVEPSYSRISRPRRVR